MHMTSILAVATAGLKPDQLADIEHKVYPRVDFIELKRMMDIDIVDYSAYQPQLLASGMQAIETRLRSDVYLSFLALLKKRPYRLVFTMGERVGIPFATFNRLIPGGKPLVSKITNWSPRQEKIIKQLNLFANMGTLTVMSQSQKTHFIEELKTPPSQVQVIHQGVDTQFFSPRPHCNPDANMILSLGEIRTRDYGTLFRAVNGLPVKLLVAASGYSYARETNTNLPKTIPDNVEITGHLSQFKLRELYARSQFVVLPLFNVNYAAGVTATLEAMSMERPVIVTRSEGILDYIIDGVTGIVVNNGDTDGLRDAIRDLISHPEEARRLGRNARRHVEETFSMNRHLEHTAQVLQNQLARI
jgi:glycosyltransferase involved in cell wall biosynthesis